MAQVTTLATTQDRQPQAPAGETNKQALNHHGVEAWDIREIRLDPFQLPHRVTFAQDEAQSFTLDRNGAVVKRRLNCGLPVSASVPARAFKGIAASALENEDGSTTVTLTVLHHDEALSIPVLVSTNMDDVAADWHAWSRMMRLPMLIIDAEGQPSPVRQQLGEIMIEAPADRRKRYTMVKRRPRFLRRRKPGVVGRIEKISAEEIIARR